MKEQFKQIRNYFGLSQEVFAKRINKSASFVASVEKGKCNLSPGTIQTICNVYGVSMEWLVDGTGEMFEPGKERAPADIAGIGKRVKAIRKRERLTQEQFGHEIGFTKIYVHYVETGKNMPSDNFLNQVCLTFHVSYGWLKTGGGMIEDMEDPVDEKLIEWLRKNPEVARELRIRGGLD